MMDSLSTILTPLARKTKTDICANSVDPDETASYEPSHQDLHCLPFFFYFRLKSPFVSADMAKVKDRRVHLRNAGIKIFLEMQVLKRHVYIN